MTLRGTNAQVDRCPSGHAGRTVLVKTGGASGRRPRLLVVAGIRILASTKSLPAHAVTKPRCSGIHLTTSTSTPVTTWEGPATNAAPMGLILTTDALGDTSARVASVLVETRAQQPRTPTCTCVPKQCARGHQHHAENQQRDTKTREPAVGRSRNPGHLPPPAAF